MFKYRIMVGLKNNVNRHYSQSQDFPINQRLIIKKGRQWGLYIIGAFNMKIEEMKRREERGTKRISLENLYSTRFYT